MAGKAVSKESLSKGLEETSLVRAKHAALGFNGRPGWLSGCHRLPHTGTGLNRAVTATVHGHTNEHPATAKETRADPERIMEGEGKGDAQTDMPKRTERAVVRGRMWPSSAKRTSVNSQPISPAQSRP